MHVRVGFSQQLLELGVLAFQLSQSAGVGYVHAAKFGTPLVESGTTETALAAQPLIGMPASACFMKLMICSSVNLLLFSSVILLIDGLHGIYDGTAGRGQVIASKTLRIDFVTFSSGDFHLSVCTKELDQDNLVTELVQHFSIEACAANPSLTALHAAANAVLSVPIIPQAALVCSMPAFMASPAAPDCLLTHALTLSRYS